MPSIGLRGDKGIAYIVMVNTRDSTQGMVKIRDNYKHMAIDRSVRPSWGANLSFG